VIQRRSASNKWSMLSGRIILEKTLRTPRITPTIIKNLII
jgi:hypothetical protein